MTTRILLVDDHDVVRQGARAIIERARPEWDICGEASTGKDAVMMVARDSPDIVILDISMPVMSGLDTTTKILELATGCRILIFTMHEAAGVDAEIQKAGAHGYVLKSQASRDLILALDQLLAGGTFFGQPMTLEGSEGVGADDIGMRQTGRGG